VGEQAQDSETSASDGSSEHAILEEGRGTAHEDYSGVCAAAPSLVLSPQSPLDHVPPNSPATTVEHVPSPIGTTPTPQSRGATATDALDTVACTGDLGATAVPNESSAGTGAAAPRRTRAQHGISKPKIYTDGTIRYASLATVGEPRSLHEALSDKNLKQAMDD
jgi:hypothetical protein